MLRRFPGLRLQTVIGMRGEDVSRRSYTLWKVFCSIQVSVTREPHRTLLVLRADVAALPITGRGVDMI